MPKGIYKHPKQCGFQKGHKSFSYKGSDHCNWKGDSAGYVQKHEWISNLYGKPRFCEHCLRTDKKRYEWANKDHKYSRERNDYMRLCVSCHALFDIKYNGKKQGRRKIKK